MIEQAIRDVSMHMHIKDAEDRVRTLHREYCNTLRNACYADVQVTKPHLAVKHIMEWLKLQKLYKRMKDIIVWKQDENFHTENFSQFMREFVIQAEKLQKEQKAIYALSKRSERMHTSYRRQPKRPMHFVKRYAQTKEKTTGRNSLHKKVEEERRGVKRKMGPIEPTLCLDPGFRAKGKRHYVSQCPIEDAETKATLSENYRRAKNARFDATRKRDGKKVRSH